jgi:uncharacterized protein (DUF1697 family)
MQYIAFLRGINIGKAKQVKMGLLKEIFAEIGFTEVKTLLNSGNVVFNSAETNSAKVKETIEQELFKAFGFEIPTIIRTAKQMQSLVATDPFKEIPVTSHTRLYVTFLSSSKKSTLEIPYITPELTILSANDSEICSVIEISSSKNTTDLMGLIEKEWGKNVTTRNWNTIQKIANLL